MTRKHLDTIRHMSCVSCNAPPPSEAHHRTGAGLALKNDDSTAVPLCFKCHRWFHDTTELTKQRRHSLQLIWLLKTLRRLDESH